METIIKKILFASLFLVANVFGVYAQNSDTCRITVYKNGELVVDSVYVPDNTLSDDLKEMVKEVSGKDVVTGWDNIEDEIFTVELGDGPVNWQFNDFSRLNIQMEDELRKVHETLSKLEFEGIDDDFLLNFSYVNPGKNFHTFHSGHPLVNIDHKIIRHPDGRVEVISGSNHVNSGKIVWEEKNINGEKIITIQGDTLIVLNGKDSDFDHITSADSLRKLVIKKIDKDIKLINDSLVKTFTFEMDTTTNSDEDIRVILHKGNGKVGIMKLQGDSLISIKKHGGPTHYRFKNIDNNIQIYSTDKDQSKSVFIIETEGENSDNMQVRKFKITQTELSALELKALKGELVVEKSLLPWEKVTLLPTQKSDVYNLSFQTETKENGLIQIFDLNGEKLYSEKLKNFSGSYNKEIELKSGQGKEFIFNMKLGNKSFTRKIKFE